MLNKKEKEAKKNENKEPVLTWTSFPFAERPSTSLALVVFILVMAFTAWFYVIIPLNIPKGFYLLGMALFFLELSPYFVSTTYEFYEDNLTVKYLFMTVVKKYSDFGCFYSDAKGIMLSTFVRPRRLDRFRGQSIRFSPTGPKKSEIINFLKTKIKKQY